jgi:uncharacterized protein (TIGR00369 family)
MQFPQPIKELATLGDPMNSPPFGREIGFTLFGFNDLEVCTGLAWDESLVGNNQNQSVHGGVITTLMDQTFGAAVFRKLNTGKAVATVELRIDYMRPATPKLDIFCRAHCYRMTRRIAFVRGEVFQDDPEKPIAHGAGSFMINANDTVPMTFQNKIDPSTLGGA